MTSLSHDRSSALFFALGRLTVSHELEAPNQICGAKLHVLALHLCINLGSMHKGRKLVVFVRNEVEVRKLRFSDC